MREGVAHANDQGGRSVEVTGKIGEVVADGLNRQRTGMSAQFAEQGFAEIQADNAIADLGQGNRLETGTAAEIDGQPPRPVGPAQGGELLATPGHTSLKSTGHPGIDGAEELFVVSLRSRHGGRTNHKAIPRGHAQFHARSQGRALPTHESTLSVATLFRLLLSPAPLLRVSLARRSTTSRCPMTANRNSSVSVVSKLMTSNARPLRAIFVSAASGRPSGPSQRRTVIPDSLTNFLSLSLSGRGSLTASRCTGWPSRVSGRSSITSAR